MQRQEYIFEHEIIRGVLNAVGEVDPKNYGESMMRQGKHKWVTSCICSVKGFIPPTDSHVLHNKWFFKTKTDVNVDVV